MKRTSARAVDRIFVLGATVCLAGNTYRVPSAEFWNSVLNGRPYIPVTLLAVVGVFAAFTPFESRYNRSSVDRRVTVRRAILASFGKILEISKDVEPALPTGDVALHIWKQRRTWRHPVSGVLRRVSTYRMSVAPANRPFTPKKGVGVVGICWQNNSEFTFDVEPLLQTLTDAESFKKHVNEHGPESVMNLSWEDFQRFRHRTALFAVPIRNGSGKFAGCISLDASSGYATLRAREVIEELSSLGLMISLEEFECV